MWRALATEGTPSLPATISFDKGCNVVLGDFAGDLLAEPWAEEAPQVAGDVLPGFDPGPHFPVGLADRRLHPVDPLLDDFVDGLAPLRLLGLVLAESLGQRVAAHALEAVDLAAGILDGEGLGVIDAKPAGALLAGRRVGELEGEGRRASRGDADVKAGAFAVVDFDPLGDPLLAHAIGQDDAAVAGALASGFGSDGSIHCGFSSERFGTMDGAFVLVLPGGEGPGPRIGEPRRNSSTQAYSKSACFKGFS